MKNTGSITILLRSRRDQEPIIQNKILFGCCTPWCCAVMIWGWACLILPIVVRRNYQPIQMRGWIFEPVCWPQDNLLCSVTAANPRQNLTSHIIASSSQSRTVPLTPYTFSVRKEVRRTILELASLFLACARACRDESSLRPLLYPILVIILWREAFGGPGCALSLDLGRGVQRTATI